MNRRTGQVGEEAAARYLTDLGYKVITRNFATRLGEIDLICRDKEVVVFVEVKTKTGYLFGRPEEMFTQHKLDRVRRMAQVYLGGREVACRIDVVAVVLRPDGTVEKLDHYQNIT